MFGEDQIAQQLSQARETMTQGPALPGGQAEPILTEAAEGRIRVTLGADGRFERIRMTLSALRDGPEALVEQLMLAINDALDQRTAMSALSGPVPDQAAMNEQVARMQDASLQQFKDMDAAIGDLMAKLHGGR